MAAAAHGKLRLRIRFSGVGPGGNAEHGVLIGVSQCRKTTTLQHLLRGNRNLVVIDFARRGQFDQLGGIVTEDPDAILRHPVVVWQPDHQAISKPAKDYSDPWSRGLHYINTVRARPRGAGVTVVHDELRRTLPTRPHPWAASMVDAGMGNGIGVWGTSQGPSRIYPPMLENSVHVLLYRLSNETLRGTLNANLEVGVGARLGSLELGEFYYWHQGDKDVTGPWRVDDLVAS